MKTREETEDPPLTGSALHGQGILVLSGKTAFWSRSRANSKYLIINLIKLNNLKSSLLENFFLIFAYRYLLDYRFA